MESVGLDTTKIKESEREPKDYEKLNSLMDGESGSGSIEDRIRELERHAYLEK